MSARSRHTTSSAVTHINNPLLLYECDVLIQCSQLDSAVER